MKLQVLLSIAAALSARAACAPDRDIIANTKQGPIRGTKLHDGVNAFLGIPFAEPPVGPLRFQPPQPLKRTHKQPLNATSFGFACHQYRYRGIFSGPIGPGVPESEDCLTLNVFVPRRPRGQQSKLPVYIWSYGGGFSEGSGSAPLYNPTDFVAENEDIIVVTWKYDLFPSATKNLGLRDQRLALEWLRDNIASFGGDPKRMVYGGQSAGSISAQSMTYAYPEDPIVSALILESGTVEGLNSHPEDDSEFVRAARAVGCASQDRKQELECMRTVDADKLKHAISNETFNEFSGYNGGWPTADNVTMFTKEEAQRRGQAGEFARLPTLIGTMLNEGDSVTPYWDAVKGVDRDIADSMTMQSFWCNVALVAGFRAQHNVPVWRYLYRGVFPEVTPYPWARAYHAADIGILMGTYELMKTDPAAPTSPNTKEASKFMQRMFGTFIRDPVHGLANEYSMPTFRPNSSSLVVLFPENRPTFTLDMEPNLNKCWYFNKTQTA
ncbi:hypothetical protein VTI74DRAFT_8071 [Chaetomium olivicolor]